jgi:HNH endonuclease
MKECGKCKENLPIENFSWKNKDRGWRQSYCKNCNKNTNKEHYRKNKTVYADKSKLAKIKNLINKNEYLKSHPCVACGENDPIVLEFDHIDSTSKKMEIYKMISYGYTWDNILKEIEKCQVLCANCHKRKTAKEFDYHKYLA